MRGQVATGMCDLGFGQAPWLCLSPYPHLACFLKDGFPTRQAGFLGGGGPQELPGSKDLSKVIDLFQAQFPGYKPRVVIIAGGKPLMVVTCY